MILIKANRDDMAAAARVAANVRLDTVFLTGIQAMNRLGKGVSHASLDLHAKISHRCIGHKVLAQKTLVVQIEGRLELRRRSSDDQPKVESNPEVSIDVVYGASYLLPEPPIPADIDEKALAAFAKINGLYNCWPYLRQEIQTIAAAMEFPFVLPTLRIEVGAASENGSESKVAEKISELSPGEAKASQKRARKRK